MSVEENNKALVRRFLDEVYNRGNVDKADDLWWWRPSSKGIYCAFVSKAGRGAKRPLLPRPL